MARLLVYVMLLAPVWGCDYLAHAEECYPRCTGTGWTLYLNDDVLSRPGGELTKEECEELQIQILPQRPSHSRLECVEEDIARQES